MLRRFGMNYAIFSLAMDAVLVLVALKLANWWRPDLIWLPWSRSVDVGGALPSGFFVAAPALWIGTLFLFSLYNPRVIFSLGDEIRILLRGSGFAGLAAAGLLYLSHRETSRWLFLLFVGICFVALVGWRTLAHVLAGALQWPSCPPRRVLIVGSGPLGQHVGRLFNSYRWAGLTLVGYLHDSHDGNENVDVPMIRGTLQDVRAVVEVERVDDVVITLPSGDPRLRQLINELFDIPVHVRVVPDFFAIAVDRLVTEDFAGVPIIDLQAGPLEDCQRVVKRIFDLIVSAVLIVILLPIMGIIAAAITLDSPGPILHKQGRVGENGRIFTMYKFRSMVEDAEKLQVLVTLRDANGCVIHKRRDDPRVTRVGRFLRQTSLDEVPQFFNIVKGDMSLVGPRPELPWLVAQYEPWQRRRLMVPQGLTGWWQVNGRANQLMHLSTQQDLDYIVRYSFWLDLRILWRTLWVVLGRQGAF